MFQACFSEVFHKKCNRPKTFLGIGNMHAQNGVLYKCQIVRILFIEAFRDQLQLLKKAPQRQCLKANSSRM